MGTTTSARVRDYVDRANAILHDIRAARARLAELRPPQDARRLHSKLMRLFELNIDFARETALLASYLGGAEAALTRLGRYEELRAELADADESGAHAKALRRFRDRLALTHSRLRALDAPRVSSRRAASGCSAWTRLVSSRTT